MQFFYLNSFLSDEIFIDIGSNIGTHSFFILKYLSPFKVLSIDPQKICIYLQKKTLSSNKDLNKEKIEFMIANSNKEYTTEDVAQNLIQIINKYEKTKQGRGKEMVEELMGACQSLKNEPWFDNLSATFLLKNLSEVAEADHKIEETEIQFLKNISEIFGVDSPRI